MNDRACYALDERTERFAPTAFAGSPWTEGFQHGGPVCGLLARAFEERFSAKGLLPVRISVDLFRSVPMQPLAVPVEVQREGGRVAVASALLLAGEEAVARAQALWIRPRHIAPLDPVGDDYELPGPDGLETVGLVPPERADSIPSGFHRHVEVRWVDAAGSTRPAAWIRMPIELVAGERLSAFQRTACIADLANALAGTAKRRAHGALPRYMNVDTSLHTVRTPDGEWIGMRLDRLAEHDGIGLAEVSLYDARGCCGRILSSRVSRRVE